MGKAPRKRRVWTVRLTDAVCCAIKYQKYPDMNMNALLLNAAPLWRVALRIHLAQWRSTLTSSVIFRGSRHSFRQAVFVDTLDDICTQVRQCIKNDRPVITMIVGGTERPLFKSMMKMAQSFFAQHPEYGVK